MADMSRTAKAVTWNGKDIPAELRDLPAGRYVVEPLDQDAPTLTLNRKPASKPRSISCNDCYRVNRGAGQDRLSECKKRRT